MELKITDGALGDRPPVTKPHPGFFHEVGEERFRKLVDDHYEMIRESDIAFLFPINDDDDFNAAKKHAADFLIQICAGPDYFAQTRGEPKMVGRHARFRIDDFGRRRWLEFYAELLPPLEAEGINPEYIKSFWNYLDIFSLWLVNTPDFHHNNN
jgi:hemoglobin